MDFKKVLITGGAGYVGSVLVPKLLEKNYEVNVLDLMIYGETLPKHPKLKIFKGDIRDNDLVKKSLEKCDVVIHLACISNDPSFELDKSLGKSINLLAFSSLLQFGRLKSLTRSNTRWSVSSGACRYLLRSLSVNKLWLWGEENTR